MNIEKLPSGSYRVRMMYQGKQYRFTLDHKPTQKEATLLLAQRLEADEEAETGTFEKYARDYIKDRSTILSPSSIRSYTSMVKRLDPAFIALNVFDITQQTVQKEVNRYAKEHSPKSVRSLHGFISAVMKYARPNFALHTTLPQKEQKKRYLPTRQDIANILEIATPEDRIAIQLGMLSLRIGEVCALTLADLEDNTLYVNKTMVYNKGWHVKPTPKTDAGNRTIILPDSLAEEIRGCCDIATGDLQEEGAKKGTYGTKKGTSSNLEQVQHSDIRIYKSAPQTLTQHLHQYQEQCGVPEFRFHDLRRFFASFASTKFPEADVMALGGWKSDYVFKQIYRDSMEESRLNTSKALANELFE